MTRHPFAGRAGQKFAQRHKAKQYAEHNGICPMCPSLLNPDVNSNHLDHIRPYKLRPDLAKEPSNLKIVCTTCHNGTCASIEAKHWPDADAIAEAKANHQSIGLDGYRTG